MHDPSSRATAGTLVDGAHAGIAARLDALAAELEKAAEEAAEAE